MKPNESDTSPFELVLVQTTTEDIIARLGSPTRSFWKQDVSEDLLRRQYETDVSFMSPAG